MSAISFSFVQVTSINRHGFWLQHGEEELYLSFDEFPDFEHATVGQICQVRCAGSQHLVWPALGIDLGVEAIRNPFGHVYRGVHGDH
jgi:hypothetical protein